MIFQSLSLPGLEDNPIKGPIKKNFIVDHFDGSLTIGSIINRALTYVFPFAGIILLVVLIMGGFQLLTSGGNQESIKAGQAKLTSAIIGFVIIFIAYWLIQIIDVLFGAHILIR